MKTGLHCIVTILCGQYYGLAASVTLDAAQLYIGANQQHFDMESSDGSVGLGSNFSPICYDAGNCPE